MSVGDRTKAAGLELDRRVRSRLLASGSLDAAAVEAYLAALPDLADHAEVIPIDQPALCDASHGGIDADMDGDEEGFE